MGELINLADRRAWKRAKDAWNRAHPREPWETLTEAERLAYKRAFGDAERALLNQRM